MITIKKVLNYLDEHGALKRINDEAYLRIMFRVSMGKPLNLNNPKTFNEKLQWLKLHDRRPEYTMMVDKYLVRDYIARTIGSQYLIPLIGVWDDPDEIDFDNLPEQFVLKCNHNSGLGMCICKDKSKLDLHKVRAELRKGIEQDYFITGREWPYKDVKRKIICEKFITDGGEDIADYKIHSFGGVPKVILVCRDRFSKNGMTEDFFDSEWQHLDIQRKSHPNASETICKPSSLDEMLHLSEKLSETIPFARTDFYTIENKVYFGEITLYPASGMEPFLPKTIDDVFGDWIKLPLNEGGNNSL